MNVNKITRIAAEHEPGSRVVGSPEQEGVNAACDWVWHDGHRFHRCPLRPGHRGLHATDPRWDVECPACNLPIPDGDGVELVFYPNTGSESREVWHRGCWAAEQEDE